MTDLPKDVVKEVAREMQAIVAADRWKGRSLTAEPPQKWAHLRPETQQFWLDTAARILDRIAPKLVAQEREREAALDRANRPICLWCQRDLTGCAIRARGSKTNG